MIKINRITRSTSSLVTLAELRDGTPTLIKRAEVVRRVIERLVYSDVVSGVQVFADYLLPTDFSIISLTRGRRISDASTILERSFKFIGKPFADDSQILESLLLMLMTERFFDNLVSVVDARPTFSLIKAPRDTQTVAERRRFSIVKSRRDSAAPQSRIRLLLRLLRRDLVSAADARISLKPGLRRTERITVQHGRPVFAVTTIKRDTARPAERSFKQFSKIIQPSVFSATDRFSLTPNLRRFDALTVRDAPARFQITKKLSDIATTQDLAGVFDGLNYSYGLSRALSIITTDQYQSAASYFRTLEPGIISLADSVITSLLLIKTPSDQVVILPDVVRRRTTKALFELPTAQERKFWILQKTIGVDHDLTTQDAAARYVAKSPRLQLSVADRFNQQLVAARTLQHLGITADQVFKFMGLRKISADLLISELRQLLVARRTALRLQTLDRKFLQTSLQKQHSTTALDRNSQLVAKRRENLVESADLLRLSLNYFRSLSDQSQAQDLTGVFDGITYGYVLSRSHAVRTADQSQRFLTSSKFDALSLQDQIDVLLIAITILTELVDDTVSVADVAQLVRGLLLQDTTLNTDRRAFFITKALDRVATIIVTDQKFLRVNKKTGPDTTQITDRRAFFTTKSLDRVATIIVSELDPITLASSAGVFTNALIVSSSVGVSSVAIGTGAGTAGGFNTYNHFRFGGGITSNDRRLTTTSIATNSNGFNINFDYIVGSDFNGGENPDAGDNLELEVNTSGNSWVKVTTIHLGGSSTATSWTSTSISINATVPARLRWVEKTFTTNADHYGIANISYSFKDTGISIVAVTDRDALRINKTATTAADTLNLTAKVYEINRSARLEYSTALTSTTVSIEGILALNSSTAIVEITSGGAGGAGIWRTTDRGSSWTRTLTNTSWGSNQITHGHNFAISPTTSVTLMFGNAPRNRVGYYSTSLGATWAAYAAADMPLANSVANDASAEWGPLVFSPVRNAWLATWASTKPTDFINLIDWYYTFSTSFLSGGQPKFAATPLTISSVPTIFSIHSGVWGQPSHLGGVYSTSGAIALRMAVTNVGSNPGHSIIFFPDDGSLRYTNIFPDSTPVHTNQEGRNYPQICFGNGIFMTLAMTSVAQTAHYLLSNGNTSITNWGSSVLQSSFPASSTGTVFWRSLMFDTSISKFVALGTTDGSSSLSNALFLAQSSTGETWTYQAVSRNNSSISAYYTYASNNTTAIPADILALGSTSESIILTYPMNSSFTSVARIIADSNAVDVAYLNAELGTDSKKYTMVKSASHQLRYEIPNTSVTGSNNAFYGTLGTTTSTTSELSSTLLTSSAGVFSNSNILDSSIAVSSVAAGTGTGNNGGFSGGGDHFRFSGAISARILTSKIFSSAITQVSFSYIAGNNTNGGDSPETGETLLLDYNIGGGWATASTIRFGGSSTATTWTSTTISISLPVGSSLRWRQISSTSSGADHYGVTNIRITTLNQTQFNNAVLTGGSSIQVATAAAGTGLGNSGGFPLYTYHAFVAGFTGGRLITSRAFNTGIATVSFLFQRGNVGNGGFTPSGNLYFEFVTSDSNTYTSRQISTSTDNNTSWTTTSQTVNTNVPTRIRWRQDGSIFSNQNNFGVARIVVTDQAGQQFLDIIPDFVSSRVVVTDSVSRLRGLPLSSVALRVTDRDALRLNKTIQLTEFTTTTLVTTISDVSSLTELSPLSLTSSAGVFTNANFMASSVGVNTTSIGTGSGTTGGFNTYDHFRFTGASNPRVLTTTSISGNGGVRRVSFDYIAGNGTNGGETPDLNENLVLQYNTSGAVWITAATIRLGSASTATSWTSTSIAINTTVPTRIRWIQPQATSATNDHYGVANPTILFTSSIVALTSSDGVFNNSNVWASSTGITIHSPGAGIGAPSSGGFNFYDYFMFVTSSPRILTSRNFTNTPTSVTIAFRYIAGSDSNGGNAPDADENLVLQYNTSGAVWVTAATVRFGGSSTAVSWTSTSITINVAGGLTAIRFLETGTPAVGSDHYAVADVVVSGVASLYNNALSTSLARTISVVICTDSTALAKNGVPV